MAKLTVMVGISQECDLSWLKQRLLFIWSRRRCVSEGNFPPPLHESVYDTLVDEGHAFDKPAALAELWRDICLRTTLRQVQGGLRAGTTFEEFVFNQPARLFHDQGFRLNAAHVNWEFKESGKLLTELDIMIPPPLTDYVPPRSSVPCTKNVLADCYPYLVGGHFMVVEVWGDEHAKTNMNNKFNVLLSGHRPFHVLLFFDQLLMFGGALRIGESQVLGSSGGSAAGLLQELVLHTDCWALAVLCAAGRLHYVFSADLSLFEIASHATRSTARYREEARQAQEGERRA